MMTLPKPTLTKPRMDRPTLATIQAFVEAAGSAAADVGTLTPAVASKTAPAAPRPGLVPDGDKRLTINVREDLHAKLKARAARERTTVGRLVEGWVAGWKP